MRRSVPALAPQYPDAVLEIGAYVSVVVPLAEGCGDLCRPEGLSFAFELGDDAVQDDALACEVSVDRFDEVGVLTRTAPADGYTPPCVELFGPQPVGGEYQAALSQSQDLDDQGVRRFFSEVTDSIVACSNINRMYRVF